MRIYVLGYMGSGKTTQGQKLAKKLGLDFYDLDALIEDAAGMKVAEIFAEKGEQHFRELEADVLRGTVLFPDAVIACGGGTPCYYNNMQWMNNRGATVWFHLPPEIIAGRIKKKKAKRPLIAHLPDEEILPFIREKLQERSYFYGKAQFHFDLSEMSVKEIAAGLCEAIPQLR
ncbi:MAG TPA: shikimate kinase [Chitinophagales bacterium]|nr:shikimate kinase [Chitinophagales bacterium]HAE35062.1 shikimate kinase [Bacteroidota bacterium]HPE97711.1 shikimate kinase [Chitinophagales bacterium]HPR30296.1 shikimate kinase [Chitinophagales bacterium]HQU77490.1 shikimate kinase [Chitinophagales bacterium]